MGSKIEQNVENGGIEGCSWVYYVKPHQATNMLLPFVKGS